MNNKPLIKVSEKDFKVTGRFLRVARLDGEKWVFPDDPAILAEVLRKARVGIDLFTFLRVNI